mgnify:CR=1 FL=1
MTTTQKTCEERIGERLESRLDNLREIVERIDEEDSHEQEDEAREELYQYPLSVETRTTKIILLSWGGPSDQLEYDLDEDGMIGEIRYRFMDWFDGASRVLTGDDETFAERLYDEWVAE